MPLPLHSYGRVTLQPASRHRRDFGAASRDAATPTPGSTVLASEANASDVSNATLSLSSPPLSIARREGNISRILPPYGTNSTLTVPKKIWFFYDTVDPPEPIAAFFARIQRMHPDWIVTYLHLGHDLILNGNVEPPPVDVDGVARMSDWYRLVVVARYGGVWLDASSVLIHPVDTWVDMQSHAQLQGFSSPRSMYDGDRAQMESWAFAAPTGSPYVQHWLEAFRDALTMGVSRYMSLESTQQNMLMEPQAYMKGYLLVHAAYDQARAELPNATVLTRSCCEHGGPFQLHDDMGWKPCDVAEELFRRPRDGWGETSFVKLRGDDRSCMRDLQTYANEKSWLAKELLDDLPGNMTRVAEDTYRDTTTWYVLGGFGIAFIALWVLAICYCVIKRVAQRWGKGPVAEAVSKAPDVGVAVGGNVVIAA